MTMRKLEPEDVRGIATQGPQIGECYRCRKCDCLVKVLLGSTDKSICTLQCCGRNMEKTLETSDRG